MTCKYLDSCQPKFDSNKGNWYGVTMYVMLGLINLFDKLWII